MAMLYPEHKRQGYTYFNTFVFNGKEYLLNTIVTLKKKGCAKNAVLVQVVESCLDERGQPSWTYEIWLKSGHHYPYKTFHHPDDVIESIVEEAYPVQAKKEKLKYFDKYYFDWEVPEVQTGWIVFILIMLLGTFLKDRWTLWIIGSIYFYLWRMFKLKKQKQHDYGFDVEEKVREWNEWKT